jgi:hypothetical protein
MSHSLGKPGPFQIIDIDDAKEAACPVAAPKRRYSCSNYNSCLNIAGALDWDNFTCRGCNGEIEPSTLWRARQAARNEQGMKKLFSFPEIEVSNRTTVATAQKQRNAEQTNLFSHYVEMLDEAKTGSE